MPTNSTRNFALALAFSTLTLSAQDRTAGLLQRLSDAAGPSGFEEPIRRIMVSEMKPFATSLRFDGMGSIVATQGTSGPRIMVDAHMDELGGMVRRVTPTGYLTMQMLGGWLDAALPDQRWTILGSKGPVSAVTGIRDVHLVPPDERTHAVIRDSIFLDIGAKSPEEVQSLGVEIGDPIVPDAPFRVMNGTANYLGKAWDDRVGCAAVVEAMRQLQNAPHPNQIFYAITTQEEVGLRGAHSASDLIKPELGISLEGGVVGDTLPAHPEESQAKLGAGPGMFLFDTSEVPNRKLSALVRASARNLNVPLQLDLVSGYGDDSAEIQKSNAGVPTVNLVVPVRYTHAHNGIMNRNDFDGLVKILVDVLQHLDATTVARLRDFTPE